MSRTALGSGAQSSWQMRKNAAPSTNPSTSFAAGAERERPVEPPDEGVGEHPGDPGGRIDQAAGGHDHDHQLRIVLAGQSAARVSSSHGPGSRVTTTATTAGALASIRKLTLLLPLVPGREAGKPRVLATVIQS